MRIEKATTSSGPHEAHKRLVGEAVEILDQGPEDFYKLLTDVKTAGHLFGLPTGFSAPTWL